MGSSGALWEPKAQTWPILTLYALYTHFIRTFKGTLKSSGFQSATFKFQVHFEDRKRFYVIYWLFMCLKVATTICAQH
jgi:hypothetical protein